MGSAVPNVTRLENRISLAEEDFYALHVDIKRQ